MKIRVVRESGGIGDVVRLFPVLDGLRAKYGEDAVIHFYGLAEYREFVKNHCAARVGYIVVPRHGRRQRNTPLDESKYAYLRKSVQYDLEVDMYCPAWAHEKETRGSVTKGRVQLFCEAAGVEPGPVVYHLTPAERAMGRRWIEALDVDPARVVAVQPFATHIARCWAREHWIALISALEDMGFAPVVFDGCRGRVRDLTNRPGLPGIHELENPLTEVAWKLAACNWLIGVDSGLFHLASAVGTPALGIFGATSGPLICEPYPRAKYITAEEPPDDAPPGCCPPCYAFRDRGYCETCRLTGCAVAKSVTPDAVLERFTSTYQPKEEYQCEESSPSSSY